MIRVLLIVEGQCEAAFIARVLAPKLHDHAVSLRARRLGIPGHKGGRANYARLRKDVLECLKEDPRVYCSTMLDLYGLGTDFPGMPLPENLTGQQKANRIEHAVMTDINQRIPDLRPDLRFIPYIQVHEFEGLLFSEPAAFASSLNQPSLAPHFQMVHDSFPTPEDIDGDPQTAPSKRILRVYPSYQKVLDGTKAAQAVSVAAMQRECPHFRSWLDRLISLRRV